MTGKVWSIRYGPVPNRKSPCVVISLRVDDARYLAGVISALTDYNIVDDLVEQLRYAEPYKHEDDDVDR